MGQLHQKYLNALMDNILFHTSHEMRKKKKSQILSFIPLCDSLAKNS